LKAVKIEGKHMKKLSSMFLFSALFIVIFAPVNGIHAETMYVIGGFDQSRGGAGSLEQGYYLGEARASIAAHFPEVSLTSASSLTPEFLAGIDILLISSGTSTTTCIQPLSTAEQTALYDFVLGGGHAILLPDNSSFCGTGTPPANESLIDPFGLDIAGTRIGRRIATILQPSEHPITSGPHGEITYFSQGWPGGITKLGLYAAPLATNELGYALAVIEPGAICPGSGGVVIYSDANTYTNNGGVGFFAENEALFLNTINFCLESLTAEVTMELPKGWSMISLPVVPESLILSDVFPGAVVVYRYERGFGYLRVKEELKVGEGYWILLNEEQAYTVTGECIQEYTLSVENGWYMIGGCTHPARVIPHNCGICAIYGFDQGVGYQTVLESECLEPGKGYWICIKDATDEATISVTVDCQCIQ
jgi:hypothetical protein